MLIFERAVFLRVPKTGSTWAGNAIRAAGCRVEEYIVDGDFHADLSYCPFRDRFIFGFVRHPLTLYRSYWRFKMANGWDARNPFDASCAADTFPDFVRSVVSQYPGWCSLMFQDYVGPVDDEIDFIGRFETLTDDLIRALRLSGESFDEVAVRSTPPVNVSYGHDVVWTTELVDAIARSEIDAFNRFGYKPALA
jgi:hypothetical protein